MADKNRKIKPAKPEASNEKTGSTRKRANVESPLEKTSKKRRMNDETIDNDPMLDVKVAPLEPKECGSSSDRNMTSIADLPPEILQTILQNLATVDLIHCRQTNRRWNDISSQVMRRRADIQIKFDVEKGRLMRSIEYRHCEKLFFDVGKTFHEYGTKSLADLVNCLRQSKQFPCTSFRFGALASFETEDMKSFLTIWGKHISALSIKLDGDPKNMGALRGLVLNTLKNLKKLELRFHKDKVRFSIPLSVESEEFQLPKLEVLSVCGRRYRKNRTIVENILRAATNLKQFELDKTNLKNSLPYSTSDIITDEKMVAQSDSLTADDLEMLKTFNKLHCLKKARINVSDDLIDYWQQSPSSFDLKLQSLVLGFDSSILNSEMLKPNATQAINQLFRTSMNTLEELTVEPVASLPGVIIPKFRKLEKLVLLGVWFVGTTTFGQIFPVRFEMADHFQNLKELDVHHLKNNTFPQSQPLKSMVNLEVLRLVGAASEKSKETLIAAAPNVKTLLMFQDEIPGTYDRVLINFGALANLTKLESLGLMISRASYQSLLHSLDAAITGFPEKFCRKLAAKLRHKDRLTNEELVPYQLKRRYTSLLDLHELKHLDVKLFFDLGLYWEMQESDACSVCGKRMTNTDDDGGNDTGSVLYQTGFTKVSKMFAFDLMPWCTVRTDIEFV